MLRVLLQDVSLRTSGPGHNFSRFQRARTTPTYNDIQLDFFRPTSGAQPGRWLQRQTPPPPPP
eukprot:4583073-Alexandrium_andersonii.AAC.1